MKELFKILFMIIIFAIIIIFAVIIFPRIRYLSGQVDTSILLQYKRIGGYAGFYDVIKIFKDASVENNGIKSKLSDIDFEILTKLIEKKEYGLKRQSLLGKRKTNKNNKTISDGLYMSYFINRNGKIVEIYENDNISNIIKNIQELSKYSID